MFFAGLCAFVPSEPIDGDGGSFPDAIDSLTVLIPNLLTPVPLSDKNLTPHYPSLEYARERRQRGSTKSEELLQPTPDGDEGLCFLAGEEITIRAQSGEPAGKLKLVNGLAGGDTTSSMPANQHSVFWMAKMSKAATDAGMVRPGLLPPAIPDKQDLLGRLTLSRGTLSSNTLVPGVAAFDHGSTYQQQIAKQMVWELTDITGPVEIVFRAFGGATETKLVLAPPNSMLGFEVTLRNLEIDAFLPEFQEPRGRRATDFEVYYGLANGFGGKPRPVPVLQKQPPQDSVHELCPPTLFRQ
jgi:hypothetical protein